MCVTSCLLPRSPCALGPRRQAWPPSPQKSGVGLREVGLIERQVCGMIVGKEERDLMLVWVTQPWDPVTGPH